MGKHVALLRGINVGGRNMLPMKMLAEMFVAAGCSNVETYIQSGNVVFEAADKVARSVAAVISQAIAKRCKIEVPVVTRAAAELGAVAKGNPFLRAGTDEKTLHVAFLADLPNATRVATLDPKRSPSDEFAVKGREVYLLLPNGVARTKLTNQYFDSKLDTVSTVRNWRTVLTLLELAERR